MSWDIDALLDRDLTLEDLGLDKEFVIIRFSYSWNDYSEKYDYNMQVKTVDNLDEYKLYLELKKKYEGE